MKTTDMSAATREVIRVTVPNSETYTPRESALAMVKALSDHIDILSPIDHGTSFSEAEVTVWANGAAYAEYVPWGETEPDQMERAREICNSIEFVCGPDMDEGEIIYEGKISAIAHGNASEDEIIAMLKKVAA